jgi:hypothetical protein
VKRLPVALFKGQFSLLERGLAEDHAVGASRFFIHGRLGEGARVAAPRRPQFGDEGEQMSWDGRLRLLLL